MLTIVCVSDTHGQHRQVAVPDGDILIHAGDLTDYGELGDVEEFDRWLGELPHRHKVVIAGNHDFCFERTPAEARVRITNAVYLEDAEVVIEGVKVYGSPWQPRFYDWAFNLDRGRPLAEKWELIPDDTQILVTHGPPAGILDRTRRGDFAGCQDLYDRVFQVRPRLHVFGHIHEAAGRREIDGITFVNASVPYGSGAVIVVEL